MPTDSGPSETGATRTGAPQRALGMMREFLKLESAGGIILMFAAVAALGLSNSPLSQYYFGLLDTPMVVQVGALALDKPLLLWVNDGLMAVFFLLVGLEIKREVMEGELSSRDRATLPAIAAVGGMAVPAAVYVAFNMGDAEALRGWAIPAATDIAFALGVLSLLGTRVPVSLKVFLLALAIIDDLGAIVIIAIFYTADLSLLSLALAALALLGLLALNLRGVSRIAPYVLIGIVLWVCVLKSGVHATLAGVALGLAIPLHTPDGRQDPLEKLEHMLHPWVAFGIMPAFAFANAGVPLGGLTVDDLLAPVPLGIALGLFVGKQVGIFGFAWVAVKTGLGRLPDGATWGGFWGVSLLAGIGFTMSLFIGTLAFTDPAYAAQDRLGVLGGSLLSGVLGYVILRALLKERPAATTQAAAGDRR